MSSQSNVLEVWLDCDLGPACQVGTLAHDRGQVRFHYDRNWLGHARAFALDPDLSLDVHPFFPKPELGNFGIFLDSSPDRWGQTLMKRREALQAKDDKRTPRTLYAWDFLTGVQDFTRQGALRFRLAGTTEFLGNEKMAAPPVTTLRELEAVAYQWPMRRAVMAKHHEAVAWLRRVARTCWATCFLIELRCTLWASPPSITAFVLPALVCQSVRAALLRPAQVLGSYIASASQVLVSALERRYGLGLLAHRAGEPLRACRYMLATTWSCATLPVVPWWQRATSPLISLPALSQACRSVRVTPNCRPDADSTANSVFMVGLPRGDKAR